MVAEEAAQVGQLGRVDVVAEARIDPLVQLGVPAQPGPAQATRIRGIIGSTLPRPQKVGGGWRLSSASLRYKARDHETGQDHRVRETPGRLAQRLQTASRPLGRSRGSRPTGPAACLSSQSSDGPGHLGGLLEADRRIEPEPGVARAGRAAAPGWRPAPARDGSWCRSSKPTLSSRLWPCSRSSSGRPARSGSGADHSTWSGSIRMASSWLNPHISVAPGAQRDQDQPRRDRSSGRPRRPRSRADHAGRPAVVQQPSLRPPAPAASPAEAANAPTAKRVTVAQAAGPGAGAAAEHDGCEGHHRRRVDDRHDHQRQVGPTGRESRGRVRRRSRRLPEAAYGQLQCPPGHDQQHEGGGDAQRARQPLDDAT